MHIYRSLLYIPADKKCAIEKARNLACDGVILDLEDAVAPDSKAEARAAAVAAVRAGGFGDRQLVLRINGLETPWGAEDLAACAGLDLAAILVPKVSSPKILRSIRSAIGEGTPLWAMIETCASILSIQSIMAAANEVDLSALVIGTNDLAKEMRCQVDPSRTALVPTLTTALLAARAYGLAIVDGVYNDFSDPSGLEAECRQGRLLGFDGKTLIHPAQIAIANTVFSPSQTEIEQARTIVAAFTHPDNAGKGVISVGGKMVELLHLGTAERVLAIARATGLEL